MVLSSVNMEVRIDQYELFFNLKLYINCTIDGMLYDASISNLNNFLISLQ